MGEKCSLRKDIENQQINLNIADVKTVLIKPKAIKFKLKKVSKKWKEEVTCEKIDLPTSDDDVPHDDIFEDDIFEDDIILKPTPKPTFEKIDDIISFPDDKL